MSGINLKNPSGGSVSLVPEDGLGNVTATVRHDDGVLASEGSVSAPNSPLVKSALNAEGDAPIYTCRAWVNFDGTKDVNGNASTANTARFIRASGNVTSVVRNAQGDYTVNFTTAMVDANYAAAGVSSGITTAADGNYTVGSVASGYLTTSVRLSVYSTNNGVADTLGITVSIFR